MLPPVLEIYVVWHPGDIGGRQVADQLVDHFHGTAYSGLVGGAVEVYARSAGWSTAGDAPRAIAFPGTAPLNGIDPAQLVAVVPVLGNELAYVVEQGHGAWHDYAQRIATAQASTPNQVGVFPLLLDAGATHGTRLGEILGTFQRIAAPAAGAPPEDIAGLRCRDLAQGITQLTGIPAPGKLTVFVSHTMRSAPDGEEDIVELISRIRHIIASTRLDEFFDASDLQPGQDWAAMLQAQAASSALLAVRTDLYASRDWCQREVTTAKVHGMPVVTLDALGEGEERGSFLMDHAPRLPIRKSDGNWRDGDITRALNLLVDECLKRALWRRQEQLAAGRQDLNVAWWAPHAPEPLTFLRWANAAVGAGALPAGDSPLRILHPDPPLGSEEVRVLEQMAQLAGMRNGLDIMTPRLLAARGG